MSASRRNIKSAMSKSGPKIEIRKQAPKERIKNFDEVALGLSEEEAVSEASRCIQCKKAPCVSGCPVEIDIPKFIDLVKNKKFIEAARSIKEKNNLPAVCGRVCPQEDQCEKVCTLKAKGAAISIGYLERFAADYAIEHEDKAVPHIRKSGVKVAVVGSGPAGLTAAADLAKAGYSVTVFESLHKAGGVLYYGIPAFRLPKRVIDLEVSYIRKLGVDIKSNMLIGRTVSIAGLFDDGYRAIFAGTGAGLPGFMGIPQEALNGIYSANEFLTRVNLMHAYKFPEYDTPVRVGKSAAVIGAGNVAMDSARCLLRLGVKEVKIVYRRSEAEMPARVDEIENTKEEGVDMRLLTAPVKFIGKDGSVSAMACIKMKLGEPDASGRRRPIPVKGSEEVIKVDTVVVAIGQGPNPLLPAATPDIKTDKRGNIEVDANGMTSVRGLFAGGDIVTGAATVIEAMGAGKRCAVNIDAYLKNRLK